MEEYYSDGSMTQFQLGKSESSIELNLNFEESEKGLICASCGRRYALEKSLIRHVKFECGGRKKYACYLCTASYTQNGSLRRHLINNHNLKIPPNKRFIVSP